MRYCPLLNPTITQKFGENANTYYKAHGLKGHPGIDMMTQWGDTILSSCDGLVYKIYNKDNPDLSRYRAVCVLTDGCEVTYGHLDEIFVNEGDTVKTGDRIGTLGNTGDVYAGGMPVTEKQRALGLGAHLHYQERPVTEQKDSLITLEYLAKANDTIYQDPQGMFYLIPDFMNGYNGCSEPKLSVWAGYYKPIADTQENIQTISKELSLIEKVVAVIMSWFK